MGRPKRTVLADAAMASSPPLSLPANHAIARIVKADGNSLFKVALPGQNTADQLLVELPGKLRNTFWLKRGGFVMVDTEAFAGRENKLGGEIVTVILEEKEWRKMKYWPTEFEKRNAYSYEDEDDTDEEESNMGKLPPPASDDED